MNHRLLLTLGLIAFFGTPDRTSATEEIPPARLVHPIMRSSRPVQLPETRRQPEYPETLKESKLGAELILRTEIDESGRVTEIVPVRTTVWERTSCSTAQNDRRERNSKKSSIKKASRQFEDSAAAAVMQWKYRPATMQGIPTKVLDLVIVQFDPCSETTP